jgi:hypothetical protein
MLPNRPFATRKRAVCFLALTIRKTFSNLRRGEANKCVSVRCAVRRIVMDFRTRLLLGATTFAVIGYFALIYGSCALDEHCHVRLCGRHVCGVIHDGDTRPRGSAKGSRFRVLRHGTAISQSL